MEPDGSVFEIVVRLHQDFFSGGKFVVFYVPHTNHAFKVCCELLDHVQDLIKSVENSVHVAMG